MKATISRRTLVALSLAILALLSLICLSACDETESDNTSNETTASEIIDGKYTAYNEDGTVNYEEFYYDSGAVSKRIEYNYEPNSLTERTETDFDKSGKMTLQTLYMREYITIKKYDNNENCVEMALYKADNNEVIGITAIEYDSNSNISKFTLTDKTGDIVVNAEYTYNEDGALIGENRYDRRPAFPEDNRDYNEQHYVATYDPENKSEKHSHGFSINFAEGWSLRRYNRYIKGNSEAMDYKHILSQTYYVNDIVLSTINREYSDNGDYLIHEIEYNEDNSILREFYYDKDGNKKQFIRYDENGEKHITNYD